MLEVESVEYQRRSPENRAGRSRMSGSPVHARRLSDQPVRITVMFRSVEMPGTSGEMKGK
jgi:hypothetical protein